MRRSWWLFCQRSQKAVDWLCYYSFFITNPTPFSPLQSEHHKTGKCSGGSGQDQGPVGRMSLQGAKVAPGFLRHDELVFSLSANNLLPLFGHLEEKNGIKGFMIIIIIFFKFKSEDLQEQAALRREIWRCRWGPAGSPDPGCSRAVCCRTTRSSERRERVLPEDKPEARSKSEHWLNLRGDMTNARMLHLHAEFGVGPRRLAFRWVCQLAVHDIQSQRFPHFLHGGPMLRERIEEAKGNFYRSFILCISVSSPKFDHLNLAKPKK